MTQKWFSKADGKRRASLKITYFYHYVPWTKIPDDMNKSHEGRLVVNNVQNCVNVVCERSRTWRLAATKVCPVAEKERLGGELLKAFTECDGIESRLSS